MMKTPEQYIEDAINKLHDSDKPWFADNVYDGGSGPIIEAIKQAQLDAIEETCGVCAENATFIITEDAVIDAGIETDYYSDGVFTTRISSESILNCAEILKKKLE